MKNNTAVWCKGRWAFVLASFGVEPSALRDVHGPCPLCGGSDRFRFDNKEDKGSWFCNQCGSGDGFDLLTKFTGRDFKSLVKEIESDLMHTAPAKQSTFTPDRSIEDKAASMNSVWRSARKPTLVNDYLAHRGIKNTSRVVDLRGTMSLSYIDPKTKMKDKFPAMIALIRNAKGKPIGVHRTYLMPDGSRVKKMMSPIEKLMGGSVRLSPIVNRTVLVAEGIESALAGRELIDQKSGEMGVYAALSANMMAGLDLDASLFDNLIICADADLSFTGEASAFALANKMAIKGKSIQVWVPEQRGCDMVDVLSGKTSVRMMGNV